MINCAICGKEHSELATKCPNCGEPVINKQIINTQFSNKNKTVALLLCVFLGSIGAHRFYVGKIYSALAMLCLSIVGTILSESDNLLIMFLGFLMLMIWAYCIDLPMIILEKFTDSKNKILKFI